MGTKALDVDGRDLCMNGHDPCLLMQSLKEEHDRREPTQTDNHPNIESPSTSTPHCSHCSKCCSTSQKEIERAKNVKSSPPPFSQHQDEVIRLFDLHKNQMTISKEVSEGLKMEAFDNWLFEEHELLILVNHMFHQLNLHTTFHIQSERMSGWLRRVYRSYREVPFHNFQHAFCVTQMTYALIHRLELTERLTPLHHLSLIFSALCHDLDHPGLNNSYQINAGTDLAMFYNDQSPLENHHCTTAFKLLSHSNITEHVLKHQYVAFRDAVIQCILATDLAKHDDILGRFLKIVPNFNFADDSHTKLLMMIVIKTADISNEVRPQCCASKWMNLLFQEYFHQSDLEKFSGLPVASYMNRSLVDKSQSQVFFIQNLLIPLLRSLTPLSHNIQEIINAADLNLTTYRQNK